MDNIRALIEEARGYIHPDSAHALYLIGRLADALESEVALREALRVKVNALADELCDEAQDPPRWTLIGAVKAKQDAARRLRAIIGEYIS